MEDQSYPKVPVTNFMKRLSSKLKAIYSKKNSKFKAIYSKQNSISVCGYDGEGEETRVSSTALRLLGIWAVRV